MAAIIDTEELIGLFLSGSRSSTDDILKDSGKLRHGRGRGYALYMDLLRDPEVAGAFSHRTGAVAHREWEIEPGGEKRIDKKAAQLVESQLKGLGMTYALELAEADEAKVIQAEGFHGTTEGLLLAILLGFMPGQMVWEASTGESVLSTIRFEHPQHFIIRRDYSLRLRVMGLGEEGMPLPPRKFLAYSWGSRTDPWGRGLGHQLFWPVLFKRTGLGYWAKFLERHGQPKPVGKYKGGDTAQGKENKKQLLEAFKAFASTFGMVVPEEAAIELIQAVHTDSHERWSKYWDRQIRKVINGTAQSTDLEGSGARSALEVMREVEEDQAKADARRLDEFLRMTMLAWMIHPDLQPQLKGAKVPVLRRVFPRRDLKDHADMAIKALKAWQAGADPDWVESTFGVKIDPAKRKEEPVA